MTRLSDVPLYIRLKTKCFAHFETIRPYTLFWCGLVSLVGACLAAGDFPSLHVSLLVFFIPILGWIAGLYLADYFDRSLDAIQKPHRPIPSGRISPNEALVVGASYAIVGLLLTVLLPVANLFVVFLAGLLVFCYAKYTKPRGLLGNLNRGAMTMVTFLFGVFSVSSFFSIPPPLWALCIVFFLHDTNSNIIGAIRDVQGDKIGGYATTPVRYGIQRTLLMSVFLSILYLLSTILIVFFFQVSLYLSLFVLFFISGSVVLCVMYWVLFTEANQLTRKQSLQAHELFVTERIIFASAFIIGTVSLHGLAVSLCLLCLFLTLVSQHLLRERYELT